MKNRQMKPSGLALLKIADYKSIILIIILICVFGFSEAREISTLKNGWRFAKGANAEAYKVKFDDSKWEPVTIPHDWAISGPFIINGNGDTGKLPWKGEGWYRNQLSIPAEYQGQQIYFVCDGIMAFPKIYINGKLAGQWDYGYNSFYINVTDYVQAGKTNTVAIHVDTRQHDSRWYPGAGIYRKIQMLAVNPVHVDIWGTQITTPVINSGYADVNLNTTVKNSSGNGNPNIKVESAILSPEGNELTRQVADVQIKQGSSKTVQQNFILPNPQRWDIENPVLYQMKTIIRQGEEVLDTYYTKFGIRSVRFTADHGFYLNDKRVQLKGVNLHHDQGPLGSAFYKRAMQRQLEIMKSMGCNAIRTSHNIPAPELLELCDEMGMLVYDEMFDKYDGKADFIEGADFDEFAKRNVQNFMVRDRNHPSVFIWSVGNEMEDVQFNKDNGFQKLGTMVSLVRQYDPSRLVTMACQFQETAKLRHFDYYDVHSWNYARTYNLARQMEPNKPVIISESASTISTRGYYEFPLPAKKTDFTNALQISSYDLNTPFWSEIPDDDFMWQQNEEYVAGEFVWTGFDYIGEPTPYNNKSVIEMGMKDENASRSSYFGIVDLCGIPKDRYYLYKSYWNQDETTVHILPHWNWVGREGKNVPVFVYTNGDCAELFLNGKSLGKQCKNPKSDNSRERFRIMWTDVIYQPGELKAIAYKEGKKIGEQILKTAGSPYKLSLSPDRDKIVAGGDDLSYILIEALDKQGNICPLADDQVEISLSGSGFIAGVGNGNPQSFESMQSNKVKLFYGKAMLIVGSGNSKGTVEVVAKSDKLEKGSIKIQVE